MIAETLRGLEIPYVALNPGASYRGLHDSIVNYLGNDTPQMLLCLHEESAVAIAQGYAKVTGKAMAAAVHSNVGLFHATMAIFNAWCDRTPVVVLGATGPVDAATRRPWIDWIHTAADQGAVVRNYTKWDDQPASPAAARESLLRAAWIANTAPMGPVYVNFDAEMQEAKLKEPLPPLDAKRFMPPAASVRISRCHPGGRRAAEGRQAPRHLDGPSVAQPRRLERAGGVGGDHQREGGHRAEDRLRLSDRSSATYRPRDLDRARRRIPSKPCALPM